MEIYIGQEEPYANDSRVKGYKFYCRGCGKAITKKYKSSTLCLIELYDKKIEYGYIIEECICKECAERRRYIHIDNKHPLVRYEILLEELKTVGESIYRKASKKFIKRISADILGELNHEVFEKIRNTTISETREKLKLIKEYVCPEALLKLKEYIEEYVQNETEFAELKEKVISCEKEVEEVLSNCNERIKCFKIIEKSFWDDFFIHSEEEVYEILEYRKSAILKKIKDVSKYEYKTYENDVGWLADELRIAMLTVNCWNCQEKKNEK